MCPIHPQYIILLKVLDCKWYIIRKWNLISPFTESEKRKKIRQTICAIDQSEFYSVSCSQIRFCLSLKSVQSSCPRQDSNARTLQKNLWRGRNSWLISPKVSVWILSEEILISCWKWVLLWVRRTQEDTCGTDDLSCHLPVDDIKGQRPARHTAAAQPPSRPVYLKQPSLRDKRHRGARLQAFDIRRFGLKLWDEQMNNPWKVSQLIKTRGPWEKDQACDEPEHEGLEVCGGIVEVAVWRFPQRWS